MGGAGKSTQIAALTELLEGRGYRGRRLAFWDDVVVMTRYREGFVRKVYHSERGIGAPGNPVNRRDKNRRGWHRTLVWNLLYLLDMLHLAWVLARERRAGRDAIVMDRYIYDELANLPLRHALSRSFVRAMSRLAPPPDLAILLDAGPGVGARPQTRVSGRVPARVPALVSRLGGPAGNDDGDSAPAAAPGAARSGAGAAAHPDRRE